MAKAAAPAAMNDAQLVSHGFFKEVRVFSPPGEVRQFVLLLSGDDGPDETDARQARALATQGAMVALVDTGAFQARMSMEGTCGFAAGAFENLARYVQAFSRLPVYLRPMLVGRGNGAALAYAVLAQGDPGTFGPVLSWGFCPRLPYRQPMCGVKALPPSTPASVPAMANAASAASAASAAMSASAVATGASSAGMTGAVVGAGVTGANAAGGGGAIGTVGGLTLDPLPTALAGSRLAPAEKLPAPWVVLAPADAPTCLPAGSAQAFVGRVKDAQWRPLPAGSDPVKAIGAAYGPLAAGNRPAPAAPGGLPDLPMVEVPSDVPGKQFAVLLSGDGGWAAIDKALAAGLASRGVPVAGLDSLRYFWTARTPESLAADLERIIRHYAQRWGRGEVLLIGFSQGADVLPFAVNRLDAASRLRVRQTVLLSVGPKASFEFHVTQWLGPGGQVPVLPEVMRLDPATLLCVYGTSDREALCPSLPAGHGRLIALPGTHHFDGDYDKLARLILER